MSDKTSQYALVQGGTILSVSGLLTTPPAAAGDSNALWLPVVNVDDGPEFDKALHWRLHPTMRVAGDRVERVFRVVPKTWEHA